MEGSGNPAAILHYNERGGAFLNSELQFSCSIPERLSYESGSYLIQVINLLREDPASRRAFVPLILPQDLITQPRDLPCPSALHFMIRDNLVELVVNMRSQSLLGVLPYDVFLFTLVQETVSRELGLQMGAYTHMTNSLHIYEDEMYRLVDVFQCDSMCVEMEAMPSNTPISDPTILAAEREVRLGIPEVSSGIPSFWKDVLEMLRAE
jgi:thymidylate synthase